MGTARETIQSNIKKLVDLEGGPKSFADKIGATKQAVNNWINSTSIPDIEKLAEIAHTFGLPLSALLTSDDGLTPSLVRDDNMVDLPIYGAIAAGTPIEMIEIEDTFPISRSLLEKLGGINEDGEVTFFLLRVEGESMNRILPNGCYAVIKPCSYIDRDNQPYAVCVNGYDATVKRVRKLANGFELAPDSTDPTYKAKVYDYGEPGTDKITIIGRVVYYVLPFDWGF